MSPARAGGEGAVGAWRVAAVKAQSARDELAVWRAGAGRERQARSTAPSFWLTAASTAWFF